MEKWIFISFVSLVLPSVSMGDLEDGLVAYYPFDLNAKDVSGNGHHGVPFDAERTEDRFGRPMSCYDFNGASSRIDVPDAPGLDLTGDFSISSWVCPRSTGVINNIVAKHVAGDNLLGSWSFRINKGAIDFQATPYFDDQLRSGSVVSGMWQNVVFTYKRFSSEWTLYIDGEKVGSGIRSYDIQDTNIPLTIGCEGHPSFDPPYWWYFDGKIDDLRIYSRVLGHAEIRQLVGRASGFHSLPPQKVFLAFDQPSSFDVLPAIIGGKSTPPIAIPFKSVRPAITSGSYQDAVRGNLKNIFYHSGINNIKWIDSDQPDAIIVYFCPSFDPEILGQTKGGPDGTNSKRRGEAIVFVNESSLDARLDAESAAHEIGHAIGLRHVDPDADDPSNSEVMDYESSDQPRFVNAVSGVFDHFNLYTHNPLYHALRYVEGWSPVQLTNAGIEPGTWDKGSNVFTRFSFFGSSMRLHNVTLLASGGDIASGFVIDQIASITLAELSQRSFEVPVGIAVTLLASSEEGGLPDIVSATGDPFQGDNQSVPLAAGQTHFSLYLQVSDDTAVPIAEATAETDPTATFCNLSPIAPDVLRLDFRGALQKSTDLIEWTDVDPSTTSPEFLSIMPGRKTEFFRSKRLTAP